MQGATATGIMKRLRILGRLATALMLALPASTVPVRVAAQTAARPAVTITGTYTVLGVSRGHTIFATVEGQLFYLAPKTGEVRTVASDHQYRKITPGPEQVTILEIDEKGNVLQKNAHGIAFYLNRRTGARVFVKWPK